jgi:uncharacterized protein YdaT
LIDRTPKLHYREIMSGDQRGEMGKNQHVVPKDGQWAVRGAGNSKATRIFATQSEAISAAREIARNQGTDLVIHRTNGTIREKSSYGSDPFPPKG